MNAIIIDDERLARVELKRLLTAHPEIQILDEAGNADEGIAKIGQHQPDLIFLDIQMPGKTGFDLLSELEKSPKVIFTTAYDEFAINAFEVNAFDYLLKPIDPKRLDSAINKLLKDEEESIRKKQASQDFLKDSDQVFVKDGDKCWFVELANIRLFESEGNYVRLYFDENKPLIFRSLNELEERLDPKTYFRANRKHIVNLKWIQGMDSWFNGGLMVKLKGGMEVEISRRQSQKFKDMMSL